MFYQDHSVHYHLSILQSHTFVNRHPLFYTTDREVVLITRFIRKLSLSEFEQRLLINALVHFRNELLETQRPTEDINNLLLKIIDAPKTRRWR